MSVCVLVKWFPKLSETFVVGEIAELQRQGIPLRIISLYRPTEALAHPLSEALLPLVSYLDEADSDAVARMHIRLGSTRAPEVAAELAKDNLSIDSIASLLVLLERDKVRHIHAHYMTMPALMAQFAAQECGLTFSVSAHAKDIYTNSDDALRQRVNSASFVATCTSTNVQHLQKLVGANAHKVHRVFHGIDGEQFCPATCRGDRKVGNEILTVGRFKAKKGLDVLVDACAALQMEAMNFNCRLIGYGDQAEALHQRIVNQGLQEHVQLLPPTNQRGIKRAMQQASVFVLPCRISSDGDRDGIPNALLEAMACGLPVITTPISGITEIVEDEVNGLLVSPDDPIALSRSIIRVLSNVALARRLGAAARQAVLTKFDWPTNVSPLTRLLNQALRS